MDSLNANIINELQKLFAKKKTCVFSAKVEVRMVLYRCTRLRMNIFHPFIFY